MYCSSVAQSPKGQEERWRAEEEAGPVGAGNRIRTEGRGSWIPGKDVIFQAGERVGSFPESKVKLTSKDEMNTHTPEDNSLLVNILRAM